MTTARAETVLFVLGNGTILALLTWLGLRGTLLPLFSDPFMLTPALGLACVGAVALSWVRYAQVGRATGENTTRHLKSLHQLRDALPYLGLIATTFSLMAAFQTFGDRHAAAGTSALLWDIGWALRNTGIGLVGGAVVWLNAHLLDLAGDRLHAAPAR